MLIEFRVANFRSIREEQALSMAATPKLGDTDDRRPREIGHSDKLLPVAAIYGANASGKTNILSALAFMRDAVLSSQRSWAPEGGVPRDPFAWGASRTQPSVFEVTFVRAGVRYEYGFGVDDECVLEEWLIAWQNGIKRIWLARDGQSIRTPAPQAKVDKIIVDAVRPNALFLSTVVQLRQPKWLEIYSWFASIETVNLFGMNTRRPRFIRDINDYDAARLIERTRGEDEVLTDNDIKMFHRFCEFMKDADIGVIDFRPIATDRDIGFPKIQVKHLCGEEEAWLPLEEESKGTRTLFRIAMPIFRAIDRGSVILIDEIESSLHPKIAEAIVKQFNSPETNPRNAQMLFTTHDTNLLGNLTGDPALRRDEVWLTEKDKQGGTVLYPLTDFKPRKAENLERGYLQGRYSAIPFLGSFSIDSE